VFFSLEREGVTKLLPIVLVVVLDLLSKHVGLVLMTNRRIDADDKDERLANRRDGSG
jgi:hypothetical protein